MTDPPSAALRAKILAEIAKTPAPTRAEHKTRVRLVVGIGTAATVAIFFATGGLSVGSRPVELVAFAAGFALFASIVLTRLSSTKPRSMLGRPRAVLVTGSVVAAPVLALAALAAAWLWPEPAAEAVSSRSDLACAALTVVQGALPLIALFVPRRGTDPVHPAVSGAALGMTAGAWSAMMAYLRCPHAAGLHCVLAHVAPTLILTGVGAILGHFLLRPESPTK